MIPSASDRRRIRVYTLRTNLNRAWDRLDWWTQIMIGAAVVCAVEVIVLKAAYPYLLEAVAA